MRAGAEALPGARQAQGDRRGLGKGLGDLGRDFPDAWPESRLLEGMSQGPDGEQKPPSDREGPREAGQGGVLHWGSREGRTGQV